ncbi:MAG: hypothetical protein ACJAVI_004838 [Candidatus Azotimanducaceae bacterium]|jgi:hypothetical protein
MVCNDPEETSEIVPAKTVTGESNGVMASNLNIFTFISKSLFLKSGRN